MPDSPFHEALRDLRADLREYMRERFDAVDARLDHINGTVRRHETHIALLDDRAERSDAETPVLRDRRSWQVGGIGACLASAAWVIWEFIHTLITQQAGP